MTTKALAIGTAASGSSHDRAAVQRRQEMLYLLLLEAALSLVGSSGAGLGQPFLHSRALRGCEVDIALLFLLRGSLL